MTRRNIATPATDDLLPDEILVEETPVTTSLNPEQSNSILAAWQGVYNLFGGRADWKITDDGIIAENFSVNPEFDAETIIKDLSGHNRRVALYPTVLYLNGTAPANFANPQEVTNFMVQYFRGSVEEGTSKAPEYVRKAAADYKVAAGIAVKRGPKPKRVIHLDNLSELDEAQLRDVSTEELDKLQDLIRSIQASK
jgi:hypothetical protein